VSSKGPQEEKNMARIRKTHSTLVMALALIMSAATPHAQAFSDLLQQYRALCEQNVHCSAKATNRGLLFQLRTPGRTEQLLCRDNGRCEVLLPRSVRYRIEDVEARLSAK
jgi:hypothetical protein